MKKVVCNLLTGLFVIVNMLVISVSGANIIEAAPMSVNHMSIPRDAVSFNDHYYYIFNDTCDTWEQAEAFCESMGGHLAIIDNQEENNFLYDYMISLKQKNAYFGCTDREIEGNWKWVDGRIATYTNWHSGEPSNDYGTEHYAMFYWKYKYSWNDGDFGRSTVAGGKSFICEWEGKYPVNKDQAEFSIPGKMTEIRQPVAMDNVVFVRDQKNGGVNVLDRQSNRLMSINGKTGGGWWYVKKIVCRNPDKVFYEIKNPMGAHGELGGYWLIGQHKGKWVVYVSLDSLLSMGAHYCFWGTEAKGNALLLSTHSYTPPTPGPRVASSADIELFWDEKAQWFGMRRVK